MRREKCFVCLGLAEYVVFSLCRGESDIGWIEAPTVHKERFYCEAHYFRLMEDVGHSHARMFATRRAISLAAERARG